MSKGLSSQNKMVFHTLWKCKLRSTPCVDIMHTFCSFTHEKTMTLIPACKCPKYTYSHLVPDSLPWITFLPALIRHMLACFPLASPHKTNILLSSVFQCMHYRESRLKLPATDDVKSLLCKQRPKRFQIHMLICATMTFSLPQRYWGGLMKGSPMGRREQA